MSKLPSVLALAVATTLLVGCSGGSVDEPAAQTPTASETPAPSETPEETETLEPEETAEATPEPSPEPSDEATTEAPEPPAPTLEPLPTESGDPFVPPPHGEPNTGGPFVPPPHGEPNPYPNVPPGSPHHGTPGPNGENGTVAYPQAGYPGPAIGIPSGTLTIGGTGYAPGERIEVVFGAPQSDQQLLDQSTVYAGPDGSYTFNIQISPALAGDEYGLMTWAPERGQQAAEESKRFLLVYVMPNS
ncbi:hypothetical protein [uncultured Arthrobacter sp.]|uniref:hypothetical protein n=1 Tax=uncultured Arthrobacter sp. TaxID=114050 RepID=UPI002636C295|nr:hypothetical protein [uncultured Arthrobacter sp.]